MTASFCYLSSLRFFSLSIHIEDILILHSYLVALRMFIPETANFHHRDRRAEIRKIYRKFSTIISLFFSLSLFVLLYRSSYLIILLTISNRFCVLSISTPPNILLFSFGEVKIKCCLLSTSLEPIP